MGIINTILQYFSNSKQEQKQVETQAASYADSPTTYEYDVFKLNTDRISMIEEVNRLCSENGDIRFQRANQMIAADATKGGFSIIVQGSERDKLRQRQLGKNFSRVSASANKAQAVIDEFLLRTKLNRLCTEHAAALLRDGDLFLNVIVDLKDGLIMQVRRAPILSIKKNINEYGEFYDVQRAFSQFDILNLAALQQLKPPESSRKDFAVYQMNHIRWLPDETKIYGTSQYAVARKAYRMLAEMEKATAYRRMFRSVSKLAHKMPQDTRAKDIEEYKRQNALVDAQGQPTKNAHLLKDFIGNVEVTALHDEANLDQIADVELMENLLWVNLLVPKAIITGGQNINRDILKVQYPKYVESLEDITDRLEYGDSQMYSGYRDIIDLQLMLAGINPQSVQYDMVWSQKTNETPLERMERVQQALGKNGGQQLITVEKAVQLIANDFDIEDPSLMVEQLEGSRDDNHVNKQGKIAQKSEAETLNDELLADFTKIDQLEKGLQKEVSSFLRAVVNGFLDSAIISGEVLTDDDLSLKLEDYLTHLQEIWQGTVTDFEEKYLHYLMQSAEVGEERAKELLAEAKGRFNQRFKLKFNINGDLIKQALEQSALERIKTTMKSLEETTLKAVRQTLANGFDQHKGWRQIADELTAVIDNPVRAEMIARTELSWAYTQGALHTYRSGGVAKVQWRANNDQRCCERCRAMHGKVYPIDDCPSLPMHPRCRCTYMPYFD